LRLGQNNRHMAATRLNQQSSRRYKNEYYRVFL